MSAAESTDAPARTPLAMEPSGPCWICGSTARDVAWQEPFDLTELSRFGPALAHAGHPSSRLVRCRACGFGQPEALPAEPGYFDTLYDIPYTEADLASQFDEQHKDEINRVVLAELVRRVPAGLPRTLLDVGCNVGRFVDAAARAGWDAEGAELASLRAGYAARRTGRPIHRVPAQELALQGRRFAAVTLIDVLEHIPRPAPLVAQLRELVLPGGLIVIKVPHGPMQRVKEGLRRALGRPNAGVMTRLVHVNHFTVKSLRRCLESAGFRDVDVRPGTPELPPGGAKAALSRLSRRAFYFGAEHLPGGVHTPLALNIQAFATNPVGPNT